MFLFASGSAVVFSLATQTAALGGTFEVADRTEMTQLMLRLRADQFLQRVTFGPKESEIEALAQRMGEIGIIRAAEEWIDEQFEIDPTSHVETAEQMVQDDGLNFTQNGVWIQRFRHQAWYHIALNAPDQLKQRIAWALCQIVVTSEDGSGFNNRGIDNVGKADWLGPAAYYDMLVENSTTTYRELLGDVTFHPIMGVYLSHLRNRRADEAAGTFPDENYAREIMQLFTIGLYELEQDGRLKTDEEGNLIPTYDNENIKTFARLFTGLNMHGSNNIYWSRQSFHRPMIMHNAWHDDQEKELFPGQTLPATEDGVADINAGLDILCDHPNVGPFIARALIQRLVRSNPSTGYTHRVAGVFNDNGNGVRGDMKAVIKAILLDREAWASLLMRRRTRPYRVTVRGGGTERSRVQEPTLLYTDFLRRFGGQSTYPNGWTMVPRMDWDFTQAPYQQPTVFNFYKPNFQPTGAIANHVPSRRIPNGKIYVPEMELFTSVMANRMANRYRWDIQNDRCDWTLVNNSGFRVESSLELDFSRERALAGDPAALAEHLDLRLCTGTMTDAFRQALAEAINEEASASDVDNRVAGALLSVLMSPAHMIVE